MNSWDEANLIARLRAIKGKRDVWPLKADPARSSIFDSHRCWKCDDGRKPCAEGAVNLCGYPRALND